MGAKFDDLVWETATAAGGTGNFTMLGPVQTGGAISFGTFLTATGDWTTYKADNSGAAWETGIVTRQSDGTYARTVKRSTNSNNAVNFSGVLNIKCAPPAWLFDHLNMIEETVTSAATFNVLGTQAARIRSAGTVGPVTSLGTGINKLRIIRWSGQTVNHNATSLILIGAANWVTVDGDISIVGSDGSSNARELFRQYAGVIPATQGGTGNTSYAIGDILYASGAAALSKLADVATGNALISGGVGAAPSWGKIALTTHVSGILPAANGGVDTAAWTAYSPTVTSASGTYTTVAATEARHKIIGKTTHVRLKLTLTTIGSGTGAAHVTLPNNVTSESVGTGVNVTTAVAVIVRTRQAALNSLSIIAPGGATPWTSGDIIEVVVTYEND